MLTKPKYKRILLKLSGEALSGDKLSGINYQIVNQISEELRDLYTLGIQTAVVIGGGNIFRGINAEKYGIERTKADYIGMLATLINALVLENILISKNIPCKVMSALEVPKVSEPFISKKAIKSLENGEIVILAAGTGNPFFTTDTAAVLRALELKAEILFKATKVDGVYDTDPTKNKKAKKYETLTYDEAIQKNLKIMDITAFSLAKEHKLPILVFNLFQSGNIKKAVLGEKVGTLILP